MHRPFRRWQPSTSTPTRRPSHKCLGHKYYCVNRHIVRLGEGVIKRDDIFKPSGPLRAIFTFLWHYPTWNPRKRHSVRTWRSLASAVTTSIPRQVSRERLLTAQSNPRTTCTSRKSIDPGSQWDKSAVATIRENEAEWSKSRAAPEIVTTQRERKMARGNAGGAKSRAKLAQLVTATIALSL